MRGGDGHVGRADVLGHDLLDLGRLGHGFLLLWGVGLAGLLGRGCDLGGGEGGDDDRRQLEPLGGQDPHAVGGVLVGGDVHPDRHAAAGAGPHLGAGGGGLGGVVEGGGEVQGVVAGVGGLHHTDGSGGVVVEAVGHVDRACREAAGGERDGAGGGAAVHVPGDGLPGHGVAVVGHDQLVGGVVGVQDHCGVTSSAGYRSSRARASSRSTRSAARSWVTMVVRSAVLPRRK